MPLRPIIVGLVAAMIAACDGTTTFSQDARAQEPDIKVSSEESGALKVKLNTGEQLKDVTYGWANPSGGAKAALLTVEFASPADDTKLREQSLQELVTQKLLTGAIRDGYREARLWEKRSTASLGPLKLSTIETWAFERDAGRQWRQTSGPAMDWSLIRQDLTTDPSLSLQISKKVIQRKWDSGDYRLELNTVAFPDLTPREALEKVVMLLARFTSCDQDPGAQPSFLSDAKLNAVTVFAFAEQKQDLLHIVPNVHYTLGRTDGRWTCERETMLDAVKALEWPNGSTWDDLIR
jgi:hypothetical protein